jgi:hypothetical protein
VDLVITRDDDVVEVEVHRHAWRAGFIHGSVLSPDVETARRSRSANAADSQ